MVYKSEAQRKFMHTKKMKNLKKKKEEVYDELSKPVTKRKKKYA